MINNFYLVDDVKPGHHTIIQQNNPFIVNISMQIGFIIGALYVKGGNKRLSS
ncbi:hypothetical protein HMPREF0758_1926 [Serratia odorifera DSM 4582]|uniref:Uncharacterized protein n=1 Tax=Serratia odorifera DSM 4582 TaxID=667129 RepID=D4E1F2_SEROD|nr:hypothetical protein HMPREF0758_1926 [Serratia odorifera DSM 4582]